MISQPWQLTLWRRARKNIALPLSAKVLGDLEADVDTVIAACGGSERAAILALLIANEFLSGELERARASQRMYGAAALAAFPD